MHRYTMQFVSSVAKLKLLIVATIFFLTISACHLEDPNKPPSLVSNSIVAVEAHSAADKISFELVTKNSISKDTVVPELLINGYLATVEYSGTNEFQAEIPCACVLNKYLLPIDKPQEGHKRSKCVYQTDGPILVKILNNWSYEESGTAAAAFNFDMVPSEGQSSTALNLAIKEINVQENFESQQLLIALEQDLEISLGFVNSSEIAIQMQWKFTTEFPFDGQHEVELLPLEDQDSTVAGFAYLEHSAVLDLNDKIDPIEYMKAISLVTSELVFTKSTHISEDFSIDFFAILKMEDGTFRTVTDVEIDVAERNSSCNLQPAEDWTIQAQEISYGQIYGD